MRTIEALVLVISFFTILLIFVGIHARIKKEFKIEISWVGVAIVPMVIWLITAGQLSEFSGFGLTLKLQDAITLPLSRLASEGTFETEPVSIDEKGSPDKIDVYVDQQLESLSFELGAKFYVAEVIRDYLINLSEHDFFRYVVFVDEQGNFVGLIPARTLLKELEEKELRGLIENRWEYLTRVIKGNALDELRGVITSTVVKDGSKAEALREMAVQNLTQLPVINRDGKFVGIIEREKLTNSILFEFLAEL